ncbi:MAG: PilZ domain-containing protein [Candidatus Sedimenticola sp. 20ELBAFRAG]
MENNQHPTVSTDERRRFFRIDDSVNLSYTSISPDQLSERMKRLDNDLDTDFTIMSNLAAVTQQMAGVLHKVEADYPDVANYLKALNKKIDILGRAFLVQNTDLSENPANPVNISASGMAFNTTEQLEPGTLLELKLLLMPSFTGILTMAEVVSCSEMEAAEGDYRYDLRVNFTHLRDADRDVLIRHVIRLQTEDLRRQREEREAEEEL